MLAQRKNSLVIGAAQQWDLLLREAMSSPSRNIQADAGKREG